jgi:hypothetical protein
MRSFDLRMISRATLQLICLLSLTGIWTMPLSANDPESRLPDDSPEERRVVVEVIAARLERSYVLADVAAKMVSSLRAKAVNGEYDHVESLETFASQLTQELRAISGDGHLRIRFHADPAQVVPAWNTPGPDSEAAYRRHADRTNYGFVSVEILPGNLGYLRLDEFGDPALGGDTAAAAMRFLANTDALMIDLRHNGGGGGMGAVLATYLLGTEPTHLSDFQIREKNETYQLWTLPYVPGPLYSRAAYLLVGSGTASAAESFTYMLQNRKRVLVVGQKTAGAANPGGYVRVSEHLALFVPNGRPVDPLTGTNWEGIGIQPDVVSDRSDALETAQRLALEALLSGTESTEEKRGSWRDALTELNSAE